jgi:hypothetical protein
MAIDLGAVTATLLTKIEKDSPPMLPDSPARQPTVMNRETDVDIPASLWSAWIPSSGPREIRRALDPSERDALQRRADELSSGLMPFLSTERDTVKSAIAAALGGFRSLRQQGADVAATVGVLCYVLRDFPAWAIQEGCRRIASNEADLDPQWPPNDAQFHLVVGRVVAPYHQTLAIVQALLSAPIESPAKEEISPK